MNLNIHKTGRTDAAKDRCTPVQCMKRLECAGPGVCVCVLCVCVCMRVFAMCLCTYTRTHVRVCAPAFLSKIKATQHVYRQCQCAWQCSVQVHAHGGFLIMCAVIRPAPPWSVDRLVSEEMRMQVVWSITQGEKHIKLHGGRRHKSLPCPHAPRKKSRTFEPVAVLL